jgi:hypothetical protein
LPLLALDGIYRLRISILTLPIPATINMLIKLSEMNHHRLAGFGGHVSVVDACHPSFSGTTSFMLAKKRKLNWLGICLEVGPFGITGTHHFVECNTPRITNSTHSLFPWLLNI